MVIAYARIIQLNNAEEETTEIVDEQEEEDCQTIMTRRWESEEVP